MSHGAEGQGIFRIRPADEPPGIYYQVIYRLVRLVSRLFWRLELIHPEHLPSTGPVLVLPNHASYLDPPFVGANLPRPSYYLARETLFRVPLIGFILKRVSVFPIRRGASDREALRNCRSILHAGWPLVFFPEGTRSSTGKLGSLQGGFALILDGLDVPYVPVKVEGTYDSLPRGAAFPRFRKVRVILGTPRHLPTREAGEKSRDYINRCIARLEADYREMGIE